MFSIKDNVTNEIIIKKSKFITYLLRINNINDVEEYLKKIKQDKKDATHYCYAYIFDNIKRFSDDSEPSGTAGMPMLNVLKNNNLNQVLVVTVRYFGGIKLGAGGLVRAYTKSVTEALNKTEIKEFTYGYEIDISFAYDLKEKIEKLNLNAISKSFDEKINYKIICLDSEYNNLIATFNNLNVIIIDCKQVLC